MQRKIIFLGTSRFALPSIEILHKKHNLLAVVTSPQLSPVQDIAKELGIKLFTPDSPNTLEFITTLKQLKPDFFCLAAYGYILSGEFLKIPEFAAINLHPSLLPKYRGAAPMQWALLNGDKYTGITTFIMDEKIDHGTMLMQNTVEIGEEETFGELELRLAKIGAEMLLETIDNFDNLPPIPQTQEEATKAPKITKEMRKINWNKPAKEIVNLIRALSPKPIAYTSFRNKQIEILKARVTEGKGEPGKIQSTKPALTIGTIEDCVELKLLKPEGKREQAAVDFINGYRPQIMEFFS